MGIFGFIFKKYYINYYITPNCKPIVVRTPVNQCFIYDYINTVVEECVGVNGEKKDDNKTS